jgi:hypothetical protein
MPSPTFKFKPSPIIQHTPHNKHTLLTMSTEASARIFFSSPRFAVVGASSNPAKFGHKSKSDPSTPYLTS